MSTKIEWTEETWNPVGGCRKISPGCENCYAIRDAHRMAGNPNPKISGRYAGTTRIEGGEPNWTGETFIDEEVLLAPLRRKKPTTYFISLSDLFYDKRDDRDICAVFGVMAMCHRHRFQILTKYYERMAAWFRKISKSRDLWSVFGDALALRVDGTWRRWATPGPETPIRWPLPNLRLGVSVENQEQANKRVAALMRTPAAVRFVSVEPLLGAVDLKIIRLPNGDECNALTGEIVSRESGCICEETVSIDWVIIGGESGPGARPCKVECIRAIVGQCQEANVPVFVKQVGARPVVHWNQEGGIYRLAGILDRKGGDPAEWPEDLRVRQMPEVAG